MDTMQEKQTTMRKVTAAISQSLYAGGSFMQRVLIAGMMALLSFPSLPGGYYACQTAMFAVLIRRGIGAAAAFAGCLIGFILHYAMGDLIGCWQAAAAAVLWLSCALWVRRESRKRMAAAVFVSIVGCAAIADVRAPLQMTALLCTAVLGAGLSLLYDGAVLCAVHHDELDGDTRPLCVIAVCASLTAALARLPEGRMLAMAFAAYLTMEHAFAGGAQAVLCGGVLGGVLSLSFLSVAPCAMLLCGGFVAGEVRTNRRAPALLLMMLGMGGAGAALGLDEEVRLLLLSAGAGLLPFALLSTRVRAPVTGLIEHINEPEVTQSEAVAVRCARMIHAWARLYEDTAHLMQGMLSENEGRELSAQCISLLHKTSAAAHLVCERTLSQIRPDDEVFRALRFALIDSGYDQVHAAYALKNGGKLEVMLTKPEYVSPASLCDLVSRACGVAMRPCMRESLLCTQALFEQTPPMTLEVGAVLRSRSGEAVAGDGYISRALPSGRHVLALSDGMGCGENAMQQSHMALSLLAESLAAGYTREQALDMVNMLMLMCTGRELYATMDLCEIDLHTGEAAFEKLGACASFIVRGNEVRAVGADTLPVGMLEEVEAETRRMSLSAGDLLVMMSDGVLLSYPGGETALCEALSSLCWLHPQAIGEKLIASALDGGEAMDDMAVLCARVGKTLMR